MATSRHRLHYRLLHCSRHCNWKRLSRLRDTSASHQRISIVEVMGRYCGDLTLAAAIAGGCEFYRGAEVEFNRESGGRNQSQDREREKHAIVISRTYMCDVDELAHFIEKRAVKRVRRCSATFSAVVPRYLTITGFPYGRVCY